MLSYHKQLKNISYTAKMGGQPSTVPIIGRYGHLKEMDSSIQFLQLLTLH